MSIGFESIGIRAWGLQANQIYFLGILLNSLGKSQQPKMKKSNIFLSIY